MGGLTFLSISMYCLNNETRSTFVTRQVPSIVFIYISNPTFPLFKNRFSDNLRLFKRQIVPIRIRNRFDFSTGSLCLSVYGWRTISRSWSIRPQCVAQCASHPLAGVLARLFFPSPSSSVFPPTVTHFRHWTPNSNTEPVFRTFRTHTEWNACCFSVYAILHPSILCSSFPSLLEAVSMYANPVYELAKCTRKCIRRTINCRSSLEEVLRNYGKLGEIESTSA